VCHGAAHQVVRTGTEAFHKSVPELCGSCHSRPLEEFNQSVHGKAVRQGIVAAPVCSSCHGEHLILAPGEAGSRVSPGRIPETCARCHGDVQLAEKFHLPRDVVPSFQSSFHGLALKGGRQTVANCASCHGVHLILPASDPRSKVNSANLPQTCGVCHRGAGSTFVIGKVHFSSRGEPKLMRWVRGAYYVLIPVFIGLMFIHSLADWIRKLVHRRILLQGGPDYNPGPELAARHYPAAFRMFRAERIQHAVLLICFVVLVWSGFALTYPDRWWARPLLITEGLRSLLHRVAAVGLISIGIVHLITLAANRDLRSHWKLLVPSPGDAREAAANFLWLLGRRKDRPLISSHSYVEKVEYWAVVWGTGLMVATGIMLWANTFFLRHLPKLALDVATAVHFYEAVLASLAIVIWHFYYVIFDPEVYPMDPAWITGYSVRPRLHDEEVEEATNPAADEHQDRHGDPGQDLNSR
jgi:cytochrome b subunit of formate dehydrogenase